MAIAADLAVTGAFGDALAGTGKPLVIASGTLAVAGLGRPGTEADPGEPGGRTDAENLVLGFAERGVRSAVVPILPAGYPGDGANRWPEGHTLDVGHLFRLALESAPAGTRWHAAGDEGIPVRDIAESIGKHLGVPAASIPAGQRQEHFGFRAQLIGRDGPVSPLVTRQVLGWEPVHPGWLADFDHGDYFTEPA